MSGTILTARERDAIRAGLVGRMAALFQGAGVEYSFENPDIGYLEANALATILAGAEQRAASAPDAILPDKAIGDSQRHHGRILDLAQSAEETPHEFAERILATRRLRLGAGTAPEWVAWAKQVSGVVDAYWYSLVAPGTTGPGVLGTGIILGMGPAQGQSVADTRVLTGALAAMSGYIDGTADGIQRRPVSTPLGAAFNVGVETCGVNVIDVAFSVTNLPSFEFPWAPYAGLAIVASTLTTVTVAGDHHTLAGLPMLLFVGTANARGGYVKVVATTAVFGGVNTVISFAAQAAAPTGTIYPAPANWQLLRDAIFAMFDAMGPGDTAPPSRFPPPDLGGDPTLRITHLIKTVMGVKGVLGTTIIAPGGNTTPAQKRILELGTLTITRT